MPTKSPPTTTPDSDDVPCKDHPLAPHGFLRSASHNAGRYVCECEFWDEPSDPLNTAQSLDDKK
jgi:hypothetical protein